MSFFPLFVTFMYLTNCYAVISSIRFLNLNKASNWLLQLFSSLKRCTDLFFNFNFFVFFTISGLKPNVFFLSQFCIFLISSLHRVLVDTFFKLIF